MNLMRGGSPVPRIGKTYTRAVGNVVIGTLKRAVVR